MSSHSSSSSKSSYESDGHRKRPPESFAEDTLKQSVSKVPDQPHYVVLKDGSNKQNVSLIDQQGYLYTRKDESNIRSVLVYSFFCLEFLTLGVWFLLCFLVIKVKRVVGKVSN